ncbi:hypothetical protein TRM7557_03221 [Tritonibacter multivorans]|uniref:Uncharacterized protein n=1 Tax=Tritonibacter multivorans TaxID=928856 RepID=A0A0P1GHK1_9RHOB|nr:hypothetical protein [Tritonibacter multivorans]MDA7420718.1 hypothetical protein [Tritonibacter multivorans]CUH81067.1 hypothetical protein TRM7557_03221 [Tritonibacter multivorans]SFC27442.1 hypothetical protein SAMN04488049_10257 [Tritonibacter multivorans]
MANSNWHIQRTPGQVILSRQLPARFDVQAATTLRLQAGQGLSLSRLAHQVRQDMWRAVQRVRGFSPVVQVTLSEAGAEIIAGGRAPSPIAPGLAGRIQSVLEDPQKQMRWMRHSFRKDSLEAPAHGVEK